MARPSSPCSGQSRLTKGDTLTIQLQANLVEDDYVWRWDTRVTNQQSPEILKVDFRQSTFYGGLISPATLRKRASIYKPSLKEEGRIDRFILDQMNGSTTLIEIAEQVADRFPGRFPDVKQALTHVGKMSQKYS
jgi:hypothetical protein